MTTADVVDAQANGAKGNANAAPPPPAPQKTCPMINPHNNLRCGQPVASAAAAGSGEAEYCTHHAPGRVPCPVDPRHFVSEKALAKHVRKCNATKRAEVLSACAFFSKDINRGRRGEPTALEAAARAEAKKSNSSSMSPSSKGAAVAVASFRRPRLAPARKCAAEALGNEGLLELLRRVREAADRLLPPLPPPCETAATATTMKEDEQKQDSAAVDSTPRPTPDKHDSQNEAIVGIALDAGVFGRRRRRSSHRKRSEQGEGGKNSAAVAAEAEDGDDDEKDDAVAVVELGAGRGYLGAAAADALVSLDERTRRRDDGHETDDDRAPPPPLPLRCSALVLVDRRAYRNKAERHYRGGGRGIAAEGGNGEEAASSTRRDAKKKRDPPPFALSRATVDLADVVLPSLLPCVASNDSMALLGKHLCGLATDFSLRAAVTQLRLSPDGTAATATTETPRRRCSLSGLAIATCCHHCCTWSDFCGKAEFLGQGFTADEFEIVAQASAWATGGHGRMSQRGRGNKRARGGGDRADDVDEEEQDDGDDDEEEEESDSKRCWQTRIPIEVRRASGDAAKRLLDGCRVRWLVRHSASASASSADASGSAVPPPSADAIPPSLSVEAMPYAPEGVTGENRLIVAVPARCTRAEERGRDQQS